MAAPPLLNSLEGGTNTTTISTANSGGASGNAFNNVTISGTGTLTYDNTNSQGALAMKVADTASALTHADWTGLGSLTTSVYFRAYLYITALPNAHWYFSRCQSAAAAKCFAPEIGTAGTFTFENAAGTDQALTTNAAPTNQWFRVEWRCLPSTTVGEVEFRLYLGADPHATNYTEVKLYTSQVLAANIDSVQFGTCDTAAPTNYNGGVWLDNLAVSTSGWIGPAVPPTPAQARPLNPIMHKMTPVFSPTLPFPILTPTGVPAGGATFPQELDATATTTATIATVLTKLAALTATVTSSATIQKQVNKIVQATSSTTASIQKQANKILQATASSTATIQALKVILKALTAAATTTATIAKQVNKAFSATATTTASITKKALKTVQATATSSATLQSLKVILKALTATVTTTAAFRFLVTKTLSAGSSVLGSMVAVSTAIAVFFLKAFDAILGHPKISDSPQDSDYSSDPKGKMGSRPDEQGFD